MSDSSSVSDVARAAIQEEELGQLDNFIPAHN